MKARVVAGIVIVLIAVAIIGGVLVFSGKAVSSNPTYSPSSSPSSSVGSYSGGSSPASSSPGSTKEFTMTASQFAFSPSTITVNEGDTVILHIKSLDVTHGIAIPQFGVSQELPPGQEETVQFVANAKGSFRFFCNMPCGEGHRDMTGMIIVN